MSRVRCEAPGSLLAALALYMIFGNAYVQASLVNPVATNISFYEEFSGNMLHL